MSHIGRIDPFRPEREVVLGSTSVGVMLFACAAALWPFVALTVLAWMASRGETLASTSLVVAGP